MIQNPLEQFFIFHPAGSNRKADIHQFVIGALQTDPVHLQEGQHDIHADPFITVNKSMI